MQAGETGIFKKNVIEIITTTVSTMVLQGTGHGDNVDEDGVTVPVPNLSMSLWV